MATVTPRVGRRRGAPTRRVSTRAIARKDEGDPAGQAESPDEPPSGGLAAGAYTAAMNIRAASSASASLGSAS